MKRIIEAGLCEGRHGLPCEEYIFPQIVEDPMDFDTLERIVRNFIHMHDLQCGNGELVVYLTGLTSCTTSLIKVCNECNVTLAVMHFDNKSREYKRQGIFEMYFNREDFGDEQQ